MWERSRFISQNYSTQCAIIYLQCCELTVKNLPLGLYDRLYRTVSRELSPMGFSESLSVEFLKVDYQSGSFVRAIRSCFAENSNFSRLKYQLKRTPFWRYVCEDISSSFLLDTSICGLENNFVLLSRLWTTARTSMITKTCREIF